MTNPSGEALYAQWLRLWNGEFDLVSEIVGAECTVHQAPFGTGEPLLFKGPDGITQMVEMGQVPFRLISFTLAVGPILADTFIAARWYAAGTFAGGRPGATAPAGREVSFHGNDTLRVEDGKIAEY